MAGLLGDIYSAIDTKKRQLKGLLSEPAETVRQFMFNQNQDAGKNLDLLGQTYKGADGKVSLANMSPQSQAAHDKLTSDMTAAVMGATVWHGSPHKFDKFDSSKIGTGEGAQAYGHGLYLAEAPEVAGEYTKNVKNMGAVKEINAELSRLNDVMQADVKFGQYRQFRTSAGADAAKQYDALMAQRSGVVSAPGNMYKVDLPDEHIAKMLDWDKPLSGQHPDVQAGLKKYMGPEWDKTWNSFQGVNAYDVLAGGRHGNPAGNVAAAEKLRQAGIPGIRYLDGGSRGAGAGSSNYVVFPGNEGLLSIMERNGQPLK